MWASIIACGRWLWMVFSWHIPAIHPWLSSFLGHYPTETRHNREHWTMFQITRPRRYANCSSGREIPGSQATNRTGKRQTDYLASRTCLGFNMETTNQIKHIPVLLWSSARNAARWPPKNLHHGYIWHQTNSMGIFNMEFCSLVETQPNSASPQLFNTPYRLSQISLMSSEHNNLYLSDLGSLGGSTATHSPQPCRYEWSSCCNSTPGFSLSIYSTLFHLPLQGRCMHLS